MSFSNAGIYYYSISEVIPQEGDEAYDANVIYDETIYEVTINVTRPASGETLACTVQYTKERDNVEGADFRNENASVEIPVQKEWARGTDAETAVIVLTKNGQPTDQKVTLNKDNGWKDVFKDLPKYDENKKLIEYGVTEETSTYDYTIEEDGNGGFIVTNYKKTTEIPVEKKWAEGVKGEKAVIVLTKNGQKTDTKLVLDETNNWKGAFQNLPKYDADRKLIEYGVDEETRDYDYTVTQNADGSFTVTNSDKPRTGDTSGMALTLMLMAVCAGAAAVLIRRRRANG